MMEWLEADGLKAKKKMKWTEPRTLFRDGKTALAAYRDHAREWLESHNVRVGKGEDGYYDVHEIQYGEYLNSCPTYDAALITAILAAEDE